MRAYALTILVAVLVTLLSVAEWGAIGVTMDALGGALALLTTLLVGSFALFARRGRWAGVRGATLRGWIALIVCAAFLSAIPLLAARQLTAESLAVNGGWFAGQSGVLAPLGDAVQRIGHELADVTPVGDVETLAASGNDGSGDDRGNVEGSGAGGVGDADQSLADASGSGAAPDTPQSLEERPVVPAEGSATASTAAGTDGTTSAVPAADGSGEPTHDEDAGLGDSQAPPVDGSGEPGDAPVDVRAQSDAPTADPVLSDDVVEESTSDSAAREDAGHGLASDTSSSDSAEDEQADVVAGPLIPALEPVVRRRAQVWPSEPVPHPSARAMEPESLEDLRDAVCALPRMERLRAAHDWIALNVAVRPDQSRQDGLPSPEERREWARMAFERREASSSGLAALFAELGCGAHVVVLSGGDRSFHQGNGPASYWNAVELGARWLVVDVAAGAGCAPSPDCQRPYSSSSFLAPPSASIRTRIPSPASFGPYGDVDVAALMDSPALGAEFFAAGLALNSVTASPTFSVTITDDGTRDIRAVIWDSGAAVSRDCTRTDGVDTTSFVCPAVGPAGGRARLLGQTDGAWGWTELASWRVR